MNRKTILFLSTILALSLTGCSVIKSPLKKKILEQSNIQEDENYKEYEKYEESGNLDDEGYYIEKAAEDTEDHAQVHVTFAENNNLNVQYFTDAKHEHPIDPADCYLDPGSSVYAVISIDDEIFSSMYEFSEFRIYEIDSEGSRKESSSLKMTGSKTGQVMKIPAGFEGTDIIIEPIGSYQQRTVSLNDYWSDDDNNKTELNGTWFVNDKEFTSDTVEISPVTPYIISYEFDSGEYFYLSSTPECYYSNSEDGIVIFNQREAYDETVDYSVELHKYLSTTLVSDVNRNISINGGDMNYVHANEEYNLTKLKYGDIITMQTSAPWPDLETNRDLILTGSDYLSNGDFVYTLLVPEKDGKFLFDPSKYSYENGTITFKSFGREVTSPQMLAKGSKIYYEEASARTGYWLAGHDHFIVVGDAEETDKALREIHFTPKVDVKVSLPQPDYGGSVIYKLNGSRVDTNSVSTYSGAVITMKFYPWEGWISKYTGEKTYRVGDNKNQVVNVDNTPIRSILYEDDGHKPKLSLVLEKSVGKAMEFTLDASGYSMDATNYGGGWQVTDIFDKHGEYYDITNNNQTIVKNQPIGTEKPINITMSNRAIQSGTAVRMIITKTDSDGNKKIEKRYINTLNNVLDPIYIYEPGKNATSTTWYKSLSIKIGVVNINEFTPPKAGANTKVTVINEETGVTLKKGDLIESGTKVSVSITPIPRYYLTGKDAADDSFAKTMNFAEYKKDIDSIISRHPAKKYYRITLDRSDSYANYSYKLDGKPVSGTIDAKDGQKLELTYEITDPSYRLTRSHDDSLFGLGSSFTTATETLKITANHDGKRLKKTDCDIETMKQ